MFAKTVETSLLHIHQNNITKKGQSSYASNNLRLLTAPCSIFLKTSAALIAFFLYTDWLAHFRPYSMERFLYALLA